MMAGLNHEETEEVGDDLAIDLEVTSNRPDCLGHIGIAREVAVLWDCALTIPAARPAEGKTRVEDLVRVRIDCPDLCPRYTARVIRGVRVGPSPDWLAKRLETIGIAAINNVVDITNYVMMECGQPLHTFDYAQAQRPGDHRPPPAGRARRSRPSTTRPTPRPGDVHDCRRPRAGGHRRRDGRGGDGSQRANPRRAGRGGRVRSGFHPHHGPATEPAQRFVVSFRAARRSAKGSIGPAAAAAS